MIVVNVVIIIPSAVVVAAVTSSDVVVVIVVVPSADIVVDVFVIASAVIVFGQQTQRGQCPVEQGISVRSSVCLYELTYFLTSVRPLCPLQDSSPPRPNLLWSQGPIPSKLPCTPFLGPMLQSPRPPPTPDPHPPL